MTTPTERRSAWVQLMVQMEATLVSTREHARTMSTMAGDLEPAVLRALGCEPGGWEATQWAADRLLKDLRMILPPLVPVDDSLGQATLDDVMTASEDGTPVPCDPEGIPAPSTPGEKSGDERHYAWPQGRTSCPHMLGRPRVVLNMTPEWARVTCRACLSLSGTD